ncbi:MAG: hypothetical protein SYC29_01215 [Planctomycetota bacterium]|nr:hypothetical protein [Planctomycetota bacterium]
MTAERMLTGMHRSLFFGAVFALGFVAVCSLWNWIFGSNSSLWFDAGLGAVIGLLMPVSWWLLERLPTGSERRSRHQQRLRGLQAERERLARGETETD